MALPGLPVSPGRARGRAVAVDVPDGLTGLDAGAVAVVRATVWARRPAGTFRAAAAVLDRPPEPGASPGVPSVAGFDPELFRDGETVEVDGDRGAVAIDGVTETGVVTAFLREPGGRILLLRRSDRVGSFRGRWAGVSGYLEDPTPLAQAVREVREETGVASGELQLVAEGPRVLARDRNTVYIVHPFLFDVRRTDVVIDWEHTESEWVAPAEIGRRSTVPNLDRAWRAVAPASRPQS